MISNLILLHPTLLPISMFKHMDPNFLIPFTLLGSLSIISGALFLWMMNLQKLTPFVSLPSKLYPLMLIIIGATLSLLIFKIHPTFSNINISIWFLSSMWFMTPLSTQKFLNFFYGLPLSSSKYIDLGWLEFWGPNMTNSILNFSSSWTSSIQSNIITLMMMISLLIITPILILISFYSMFLITTVFHTVKPFGKNQMFYALYALIPFCIIFIIINRMFQF